LTLERNNTRNKNKSVTATNNQQPTTTTTATKKTMKNDFVVLLLVLVLSCSFFFAFSLGSPSSEVDGVNDVNSFYPSLCFKQEKLYGVCSSSMQNERGTWVCEIDPFSGEMTILPFFYLPSLSVQWAAQTYQTLGNFGANSMLTQVENWFDHLSVRSLVSLSSI